MSGLNPFLNAVEQFSNAAGTGTVTLGALVTPNALTMVQAGAVNGQQYTFRFDNPVSGDFEVSRCTWNSGAGTITRDTVIVSVIAGVPGTSKISLAATSTCRVVAASEDLISRQQSLSRGWLIGG